MPIITNAVTQRSVPLLIPSWTVPRRRIGGHWSLARRQRPIVVVCGPEAALSRFEIAGAVVEETPFRIPRRRAGSGEDAVLKILYYDYLS